MSYKSLKKIIILYIVFQACLQGLTFFIAKEIIILLFVCSTLYFYFYANKNISYFQLNSNETNLKIKSFIARLSENGDRILKASVIQNLSVENTNQALKQISEIDSKHLQTLFNSLSSAEALNIIIDQGIESFKTMNKSIDVIRDFNNKIIFQISKNENEFNKVIKMIKQIDDKSKVISDIAFQSKILAFNASVEAARAGEHGKGFTVVAQEIENLANSSSKSATDISTLLNVSVTQVNEILRNGQKEMGDIVADALEKIGEGSRNAKKCEQMFAQMTDEFLKSNHSVDDISKTATDQFKKFEEVSMMMNKILEICKNNEIMVKEYFKLSNELLEHNSKIFNVQ
jgi:methyl-accepting chemotaxis protein